MKTIKVALLVMASTTAVWPQERNENDACSNWEKQGAEAGTKLEDPIRLGVVSVRSENEVCVHLFPAEPERATCGPGFRVVVEYPRFALGHQQTVRMELLSLDRFEDKGITLNFKRPRPSDPGYCDYLATRSKANPAHPRMYVLKHEGQGTLLLRPTFLVSYDIVSESVTDAPKP